MQEEEDEETNSVSQKNKKAEKAGKEQNGEDLTVKQSLDAVNSVSAHHMHLTLRSNVMHSILWLARTGI